MLKSVAPSTSTEPKVGIFLNGFKDESNFAWVVFSSVEVKEQYIRDEFKFCRKEEDLHNLARHKNQRDRTKDELMAKRAAFATFSGYKPSLKDKNRFVFVGHTNETAPKSYA